MISALSIAEYDVPTKQGTDLRVYFVFRDSDEILIDFTGHTCRFRAVWRNSVVLSKTSDELFTDAEDVAIAKTLGKIHLHLTEQETRQIPVGRLMNYAIELWQDNGDQRVILEGYLVGERGNDNAD